MTFINRSAIALHKIWLYLGLLDVAVIIVLSLISASAMNRLLSLQFSLSDKLGHLAFYGFASFCFSQSSILKNRNSSYPLWLNAAGLFVLGALLEVTQYLARMGRQFDILDLAANTAGIMTGMVLAMMLRARAKSGNTLPND